VVLGAGHSYRVDAKYDGDSDHQPASATASIDNAGNLVKGSTGSTQQNNNAGNSQQNNNANQVSAATPQKCDLTVGTPSDEAVPGSIIGKLSCGGQGIPRATIKISGLPGGADSITTSADGSYELGVFSPFKAGQSYTITANFDGDSAHQAASATTSVNIKGSTGSNNAGNSQQNNSTQP
jgi:hypothetical protein